MIITTKNAKKARTRRDFVRNYGCFFDGAFGWNSIVIRWEEEDLGEGNSVVIRWEKENRGEGNLVVIR